MKIWAKLDVWLLRKVFVGGWQSRIESLQVLLTFDFGFWTLDLDLDCDNYPDNFVLTLFWWEPGPGAVLYWQQILVQVLVLGWNWNVSLVTCHKNLSLASPRLSEWDFLVFTVSLQQSLANISVAPQTTNCSIHSSCEIWNSCVGCSATDMKLF